MPAPRRRKQTSNSSAQADADADVDFEEQHDWDMYQEWLEKLDTYLWETGKKKTAQQIGEEISKMLENQRLELEMKHEQQKQEAISSGKIFQQKEEIKEDPTAVIDEDQLEPKILKKIQEEVQEIRKDELVLLNPEQKKELLALKKQGNDFFGKGQYEKAVDCYSKAIEMLPKSTHSPTNLWILQHQDEDVEAHALFSNRAAAYMKLSKWLDALQDCEMSVAVKPDWWKGHFRKGLVLRDHLKKYRAASDALEAAYEHSGHAKDVLKEAFVAKVERNIYYAPFGNVFTWGKGKDGELGKGADSEYIIPQKNETFINQQVFMLATSFSHSVAVTKDGTIYSWGKGDNYQLGHGDIVNMSVPKPIAAFKGIRIIAAACGREHTVAVSIEGLVYTWGFNEAGRLGHGPVDSKDSKVCPQPTVVEKLRGKFVTQVSCGKNHTLVATYDNELYSWGDNYHGQCGCGTEGNEKHFPVKVKGLEDKQILQIACGDDHCLVLEKQYGMVYSWGRGSYGCLGLANDGDWCETSPKALWKLYDELRANDAKYENDYPVMVSAGGHHNAICTFRGQVYVWGRCDEGALGLGECRPRVSIRVPHRVDFGEHKVTHVACGKRHTVAITSKGFVWTMGKGDMFNFAAGGSYWMPQKLEGLEDVFPVTAFCGYAHSLVIASNTTKAGEEGPGYQVPYTIVPPPKSQRLLMKNEAGGEPTEIKMTPLDTKNFAIANNGGEDQAKKKTAFTDYRAWDKWKADPEIEEEEKLAREQQKKKNKSGIKFKDFKVYNDKSNPHKPNWYNPNPNDSDSD